MFPEEVGLCRLGKSEWRNTAGGTRSAKDMGISKVTDKRIRHIQMKINSRLIEKLQFSISPKREFRLHFDVDSLEFGIGSILDNTNKGRGLQTFFLRFIL